MALDQELAQADFEKEFHLQLYQSCCIGMLTDRLNFREAYPWVGISPTMADNGQTAFSLIKIHPCMSAWQLVWNKSKQTKNVATKKHMRAHTHILTSFSLVRERVQIGIQYVHVFILKEVFIFQFP